MASLGVVALLVGMTAGTISSLAVKASEAADATAEGGRGCDASPVHYQRGPEPLNLLVPWVAPKPRSSGLTGYLFYYSNALSWGRLHVRQFRMYARGHAPDAQLNMKILWTPSKGATKLRIRGKRLEGSRSSSQNVLPPVPGRSHQFPSIVKVPEAGCWRLTIQAGRSTGRLTVLVVSAT
jgi:hypothetical protein